MKGDFTRGIQPDRKRGKRYRRVLVQQSRVLLDSDAAALVDAFDHELRQVTADLGCRRGSPDDGYLITPGRLLALFEHVDHVTATGTATAMRDYAVKYPEAPYDRYPSLRIEGAGDVTIPLVEPLAGAVAGQARIWYRAAAAGSITVTAGGAPTAVAIAATSVWAVVEAPVAVATNTTLATITVTGDPAQPVWIGLVELREDRQTGPHFWAAAGRFHADGLTPQLATATGYPAVSYPEAAGFPSSDAALDALASGAHVVAYLETWERDITAAEDPGIREVALGKVDTTVRTEVIGQVKWADAGTLDADALRAAFEAVAAPQSELVVSAPTTPPSTDPCALPTSGGYTGADHRLYRFEVHVGGAPAAARIKWSRDNACHVFPVRDISGNLVTLDRSSGLAAGDIVEILSDVVDLADAARATVSSAGVTPATRQVGLLARLKQEASDSQGRDVFALIDLAAPPAGVDPSTDPARYPTIGPDLVPLRLRRWDGLAAPADDGTGTFTAIIEDGIEISVAGVFQPGEYWQYEARRGVANANGAWWARPHGPERILAPLALLGLGAAGDPAVLEAWLDDRFSSLCELDADDIAFDGERVGTDADTVQEAIEELYERDTGNCCDATLGPNGRTGDDSLRILATINASTFPSGGHLCLEHGVYDIRTPIVIGKDVVIRGCPEATLLSHGDTPIFQITAEGRLRIEQLVLYNGPEGGSARLVELEGGGRLIAREVGFLATNATAIAAPNAVTITPDFTAGNDPVIDPDNLPPREDAPSQLALRDCVVLARDGIAGVWFTELAATGTAFVFGRGGIAVERVDQLALEGCAFRSGLTSAFFASRQPEHLRAQTDELLDAVAALPIGDGFGVAIAELLGGVLAQTQLRAQVGVWARVARDATLRDVEHEADGRSWGIRLHHARRVDIEGARISAQYAIEVPLSARQLAVRRGLLDGRLRGVAIAGENAELVNAGAIVGVTVEGNHVATVREGIAIGAAGTKAGEVDDVRITGNVVRVSGEDTRAAAIIAVGDGDPRHAVIVDANDITTSALGIQIAGAGAVIRGNQIQLAANGPAIGVYATSAVLGQVSVVDNAIAGVNNSFTAIRLDGTPDLHVTGNQVRTTAAFEWITHPTALSVTAATTSVRHFIVGNDFAVGSVAIHNAHELHLVGNTIRLLTVDSGPSGQNGVIHGNKLTGIVLLIIPISAVLRGLRGMWRISDNLAPGGVEIAGATHEELIRWPWLFIDVAAVNTFRKSMVDVSDADRKKLIASGFPTMTARSMELRAEAPWRDALLGEEVAAPTSMREIVATEATIADIQRVAEMELAAPLRDFFLDHDVFFHSLTVVDPFDFQVSSNRFGILVVDAASGFAAEASSTLHVVDNKITLNCNVEMFTTGSVRLDNIVAHNSATQFAPPVASTTSPILYPNLRR